MRTVEALVCAVERKRGTKRVLMTADEIFECEKKCQIELWGWQHQRQQQQTKGHQMCARVENIFKWTVRLYTETEQCHQHHYCSTLFKEHMNLTHTFALLSWFSGEKRFCANLFALIFLPRNTDAAVVLFTFTQSIDLNFIFSTHIFLYHHFRLVTVFFTFFICCAYRNMKSVKDGNWERIHLRRQWKQPSFRLVPYGKIKLHETVSCSLSSDTDHNRLGRDAHTSLAAAFNVINYELLQLQPVCSLLINSRKWTTAFCQCYLRRLLFVNWLPSPLSHCRFPMSNDSLVCFIELRHQAVAGW